MSYNAVTWSSEDLVTATKIGNMCGNHADMALRAGELMFCEEEEHDSAAGAWAEIYRGYSYLPPDIDELTIYLQLKITGAGTGYAKVSVGAVDSGTMSDSNVAYQDKSSTIDTSSLSEGVQEIIYYLYTTATTVVTRAINIVVTP